MGRRLQLDEMFLAMVQDRERDGGYESLMDPDGPDLGEEDQSELLALALDGGVPQATRGLAAKALAAARQGYEYEGFDVVTPARVMS